MPTEIPLTTDPSSIFEITLNSRLFQFQTKYNTRGALDQVPYWTVDISENDAPLITGLALVLGVNLLRGYNLDAGALVMLDRTDTNTEATENNLGDTAILLYYTPEEESVLNG